MINVFGPVSLRTCLPSAVADVSQPISLSLWLHRRFGDGNGNRELVVIVPRLSFTVCDAYFTIIMLSPVLGFRTFRLPSAPFRWVQCVSFSKQSFIRFSVDRSSPVPGYPDTKYENLIQYSHSGRGYRRSSRSKRSSWSRRILHVELPS